jgi:hypothetical protein
MGWRKRGTIDTTIDWMADHQIGLGRVAGLISALAVLQCIDYNDHNEPKESAASAYSSCASIVAPPPPSLSPLAVQYKTTLKDSVSTAYSVFCR